MIQIFDKVLRDLPEKTGRIFRLSRLEFRSTREISQTLGIPERTVEYHITRSLQSMRQQLKDFLPTIIFLLLCQ
ncbi:sigma factor-like helix-turn-helix DNA-binding protein [Persicitalea sp.]|uniref:sigma factor-like helix-turn-helix DNA-binding protein n=1 Tax=Persicitalea sp. TaxID=3100273 RepID=UPI0035941E35